MSTETPQRRSRFRWIPTRSGRSKVIAGLTALAVPFAAMVGLASPASAATSATATYTKKSDWGSGFEGQWTVKNTGTTALSSWTIEWDYPSGTRVNSAWDATVTNSGTRWTAKNLGWNGSIAPGASVSFGFNGSGPGAPSGCKLNGAACDGSTVPGDNPPSAPGTPTTSDVTNTSVKLSWSAATDDNGVKNYDVLRNGSKIATVTGTTYTNTGLTAGTDYTYAVQARDTIDQLGPVSGSVSVRTTGGDDPPPPGDKINLGYFTNWGVYGRNYHVKNLVTSGSAAKITHINYAFGNVQNGRCTIGDSYADYDKAYTADQSVDGVADTWDQPLRGNFNQLRKLKAKYPHIKVLWSFGGWTWSGGFGQAVQNPAAFAQSCYDLVEDP
ncbi:cellulose binding domain-containing protein, partial [Streptomyces sp. B27]